MSYKTRLELQPYMIQNGENWILSLIHNRPHSYLADNSDFLMNALNNLSGKLGLSPTRSKMQGFPIYHNTYYVKTGMTFIEALSVLDAEIKVLEDLHTSVLADLAIQGAVDWIIELTDSILVVNDTDSYPEPLKIHDLGTFFWLSYAGDQEKGKIWITENMESDWYLSSKTIESIFGISYSLEKHTNSLLTPISNYTAVLLGNAFNETGETGYNFYIKRTSGTIDYDNKYIDFESEGTDSPSSYINDYNIQKNFRYMTSINTDTYGLVYLVPTDTTDQSYVLERPDRLIPIADLLVYRFLLSGGTINGQDHELVLPLIEGTGSDLQVPYISYLEPRLIGNDRFGMVVCDNLGNLIFRVSTDGLTWNSPVGAADDGIFVPFTYAENIDYPTFLPVNDGYVCFFNTNYQNGVLDDIHYAYTRDGINWTIPSTPLGIEGIFPKLVKTRNGGMYLLYWNNKGIQMLKLHLSVERTYTVGG